MARYRIIETRQVVVDTDAGWAVDPEKDPEDEALWIARDCLVSEEWDTLDREVEAL